MSKRLTALLLALVVTALLCLVPVCAEGEDSSAAESTASDVSSAESASESSADESGDASGDTSSTTSGDTSAATSKDTSSATSSNVSDDKSESKGSSFPWGPVIFAALIVIFIVVCVICVKSKNRFGLWLSKQLRDYKSEISKISWLGPNELVKQTGVAIAILIVAAVVLGVLDWAFSELFKLIVNLF